MHEPDLLVLDEPTGGLDPLVQETFYELVAEATRRGGTVFLSSHVLSEVQHVADRVALIRDGRLELVDSVENASQPRVHARGGDVCRASSAGRVHRRCPGVRELERTGHVVRFALEGEIDALLKALARFHVQGARRPRGRSRGHLPGPLPRARAPDAP